MVAIYSRLMQSLLSPHGVYAAADVDVALARVFGVGVRPLHIESALFEAMLSGWRAQQTARYLKAKTIRSNEVGVRRFQEQVGCWPWEWRASHVDEYFEDLLVRPVSQAGFDGGSISRTICPWVRRTSADVTTEEVPPGID